jgi:hypothetical protein
MTYPPPPTPPTALARASRVADHLTGQPAYVARERDRLARVRDQQAAARTALSEWPLFAAAAGAGR